MSIYISARTWSFYNINDWKGLPSNLNHLTTCDLFLVVSSIYNENRYLFISCKTWKTHLFACLVVFPLFALMFFCYIVSLFLIVCFIWYGIFVLLCMVFYVSIVQNFETPVSNKNSQPHSC